MKTVLYAENLGYYASGKQKFGLSGDFVTAPEISPLFSYCLANQCREIVETLKKLEDQNAIDILELGAGSGIMAAHILQKLAEWDSLPDHYYILELSADLKALQVETLHTHCGDIIDRIVWIESLPFTPLSGVILANEVMDAMPVHRFKVCNNQIYEQFVDEQEGKLISLFKPSKIPALEKWFHQYSFTERYCSEINPYITPWIQSLSDTLNRGVILLCDYGFPRKEYYHPDRTMGTLMCHYKHFAHADPFLYVGLQDITAHVDFTHVAEAALDASLDVLGFTSQASFLLSTGLLDFAKINTHLDSEDARSIRTLTSTAEMGELFKVMALGKGIESELIGFTISNKLYVL